MNSENKIKQIKDLPSPKGVPILGHLPQFNSDNKHQVLERWVEECGDLFSIHFVGKRFVVSANPQMNEELLRMRPEQFRRFHKISEILEEMGILGVFNAEGETWKRHRKLAAEALSLKKVRSFYSIISEKTMQLIRKWEKLSHTNTGIDVQKEFMKYTVDITTEIAFGYSMDTMNDRKNEFQKHLEHIFPMVNHRITSPLPTWRYLKQRKDRELETSLKAIEKLIYQFIGEAKKRLETQPELVENPSNFLEALLVEQSKSQEHFSDAEVYGNVFSMLLAGEDTTSNSISWAMYFLSQRPDVVTKVRAEAEKIYGDGIIPVSDRDLMQLKYASAVAEETLRLKSVTPNLYLEANESVVLNSLHIPKGTVLMLQTKVAQTRESHFSNADQFIPERWIRGGCPMHENHDAEVMRSFGGGARFCPGKNLAMHEMTLAISAICKAFTLELAVQPSDVIEHFSFTMFPKNLLVKLKAIY